MDAKFYSAMTAVKAGDLERFKAAIAADPTLATSRSTCSHPTLLQCVVLDGHDKPHNVEMAQILIDAGGDVNGAFAASASIDNRACAELLLEHGAVVDGTGGWSPLEEALYWNNKNMIALLLERGAKVQNLRTAAGLGRTDLIQGYFNPDGTLKPEAGQIDWPFGARSWPQDQQGIVTHAFVFACMHGHIDAATRLLERGGEINTIPDGFDFAGTGLHYAALNGHRPMIEFLLSRGADRNIKDTKVGSTAAGWAEHGGHNELLDLLR